jgi:hypothetical protein
MFSHLYFADDSDSRLITLERLVVGGYLKNNRQMIASSSYPSLPRLFRVVCSMTELEKLTVFDWNVRLTEDFPQLFRSCPKLTELRLKLAANLEMGEDPKNELRSGFQRLRLFELDWYMNSGSLIQEMFT